MDIRRRVGIRRAVRLIVAVIGVACVGSGSREWTRAVGAVASASAVGQVDGRCRRLKGTVWVVNRDRGELAIFDVDTGNVLATRPVGAGAHDICISEQAGKAYITAETIGIVTTVDLETLAMESIPVGPLPHHLEPSHDGRTIYVSLASHTAAVGTPQYAAIDTESNRVSYGPTSASAAARSHGPHPSLDGETLYVTHDIGDRVSAVDRCDFVRVSHRSRGRKKRSPPGSATCCGYHRVATTRSSASTSPPTRSPTRFASASSLSR